MAMSAATGSHGMHSAKIMVIFITFGKKNHTILPTLTTIPGKLGGDGLTDTKAYMTRFREAHCLLMFGVFFFFPNGNRFET